MRAWAAAAHMSAAHPEGVQVGCWQGCPHTSHRRAQQLSVQRPALGQGRNGGSLACQGPAGSLLGGGAVLLVLVQGHHVGHLPKGLHTGACHGFLHVCPGPGSWSSPGSAWLAPPGSQCWIEAPLPRAALSSLSAEAEGLGCCALASLWAAQGGLGAEGMRRKEALQDEAGYVRPPSQTLSAGACAWVLAAHAAPGALCLSALHCDLWQAGRPKAD